MSKAGFLIGKKPVSAPLPILFFLAAAAIISVLIYFYNSKKGLVQSNIPFIAGAGFAIAVTFGYISLYFPDPRAGTTVGAATVPQVWAAILVIMAIMVLVQFWQETFQEKPSANYMKLVLVLSGMLLVYVLIIPILGFLSATATMLMAGMMILKHKNIKTILITTGIVIGLMYGIFYVTLQVPLLTGTFF